MPGIIRNIFIVSMIFINWYLGYQYNQFEFITRILFMIIAGIFQGMLLIHIMHDTSHTAFTHIPFIWSFIGHTCLDFIAGCSFDAWLHQHVVGHHVYTNIMCIDPDCPPTNDGDARRIAPNQKYYKRYAYQFIYLPILYSIYAFKNRAQDISQTLSQKLNGNIRVNPYYSGNKSAIRLAIFKTLWIIRVLIIPLFYFNVPWYQWIPLFCAMELTIGYFLTFNFQVSFHVSTGVICIYILCNIYTIYSLIYYKLFLCIFTYFMTCKSFLFFVFGIIMTPKKTNSHNLCNLYMHNLKILILLQSYQLSIYGFYL